MTTDDTFNSRVAAWLREESEYRVPDHLDEVLVRTMVTRQRTWWSSPQRWLPMDRTLSTRRTVGFRPAWILLAAALLLAVLATILAVGGGRRPPAPFGPAANGAVVYGTPGGDIYTFDPATGVSKPLITGPARDVAALFSRDGSMLVFARQTTTSDVSQLMLARADGTLVRALTGPLAQGDIDWSSVMDWSPDGSRLAYVDSQDSFFIVRVDGSRTERIDVGMKVGDIRWRPNGQELVFRGVRRIAGADIVGLFVVGADGTNLREIAPPTLSEEHWQEPALSPDGNRVLYTQWGLDGGHLHVVDIDTGDFEQLMFDQTYWSDYYGEWSPDGSHIVFNRGVAQDTYHLAVAPATGGEVVDIGPALDWDAASIAAFSPDGSKVIARFSNRSTWIFDATGGPGQRIENATDEPVSWQRIGR